MFLAHSAHSDVLFAAVRMKVFVLFSGFIGTRSFCVQFGVQGSHLVCVRLEIVEQM